MKSLTSVVGLAIVAALAGTACDKGPKSGGNANPPAAKAATTEAPTEAPGATKPAATGPAATGDGQTFGKGVALAEVTPIDKILADPKAFAGKTVRAEGMVTDVCLKRGCWFDMAGDGAGQKLRFKVVDGEMVFPPEAKGKFAVAEGVVSVQELSLEDSVAYLQEQAQETGAPFDPASVKEPVTMVRIDGTGAVIRDKR